MSRKGFVPVVILLIIAAIITIGGVWYYTANKFVDAPQTSSTDQSSPSISKTLSTEATTSQNITTSSTGISISSASSSLSATTHISRFFSTSTDATTTAIADKMILANSSNVYVQLHSPGDLSIQDTHGHVTGVINGVATNTFPFASYDPITKTAHIFFPQDDNLTYKITGTGTGVYGLDVTITSGTQQIVFHRDESAPIVPGEVDTYMINPNTVLNHGDGITLSVDKKGNGMIDEVEKFGANIVNLPLEGDHNTPYQELPKPKKTQASAVQSRPVVITPRFQVPTTTPPVNLSTTIPMVATSSTIATSTE